jgi:hypothetical protein
MRKGQPKNGKQMTAQGLPRPGTPLVCFANCPGRLIDMGPHKELLTWHLFLQKPLKVLFPGIVADYFEK